jgi:phosphohistidine phosphatase
MKTLILVRHAKSDHSVVGLKDFDRTLNEQGHREAPKMAKKFSEKGIKINSIVSSPALRTKLTTEYITEQIGYKNEDIVWNENIYEASVRILANEFSQFDDKQSIIMVVGHNPGLSYFAENITKADIGEMPTSSFIAIELNIDSWKEISSGIGKVLFYEYPENTL